MDRYFCKILYNFKLDCALIFESFISLVQLHSIHYLIFHDIVDDLKS